ncbi:hypothetical protein BDV96DRAFT_570822 [Lophiotrema nucula]|uniref:F-box domain-containing protein n=1 Tax=Lophiotrema nucula TaxID=690887 RepID=A0A6A5ZF61_9PLEO|nr:hypothetical protein BDV96DRAFT_570822 [Lophiotrema nucula]
MVNTKNVAFKVDKQAPTRWPPTQPYSTVINCRKSGGKKGGKVSSEIKSQQVPLTKVPGFLKDDRKRGRSEDEVAVGSPSKRFLASRDQSPAQEPKQPSQTNLKPTRLRRGKPLTKHIDLDCWFTILRFSDPAQLLEMRTKIASCYRFLRDNPTLWKYSRSYYYGDELPEPPAELTEFQYADLRHGHGCMSCGTSATRKTYWAFLRRWCKPCLQSKTIREHDARPHFKGTNGEDISFIQHCLPSGLVDSWGNFVGVGPAHNHALKTVYLLSDVQKLVEEFKRENRENIVSWHAEMRTWMSNKAKVVEDRRTFARKMEQWEDLTRSSKSYTYQEKKDARKRFFIDKASELSIPIDPRIMERCPSFKRAIAIPKDPSMNSWLQLKPKLEKEAHEVSLEKGKSPSESSVPTTGTSTPISDPRGNRHIQSLSDLQVRIVESRLHEQQHQIANLLLDTSRLGREIITLPPINP